MGNVGSIFTIDVKDKDGKVKEYTFFCTEKENGYFGLVYTTSFGSLTELLNTSIGSNKVDKGDCLNLKTDKARMGGGKFTNFYTKLKTDNISEYLKSGSTIKLGHTEGTDFGNTKEEELTITNLYWLVKDDNSLLKISDPKELERAKAWFTTQGKQWKIVNRIPDSAKIQKL